MYCGKVVHENKHDAVVNGIGHNAYYCDDCKGWHTSFVSHDRSIWNKRKTFKVFYDRKRKYKTPKNKNRYK